jgi:hypothetical protein
MGGLYSTDGSEKTTQNMPIEKEQNPNSDVWNDLFGDEKEGKAAPTQEQEFRGSIVYTKDVLDALNQQLEAVHSDSILREYVLFVLFASFSRCRTLAKLKQDLIPFPDEHTKVFHFSNQVKSELPLVKLVRHCEEILRENDRAQAVVKQAVTQREYVKYDSESCSIFLLSFSGSSSVYYFSCYHSESYHLTSSYFASRANACEAEKNSLLACFDSQSPSCIEFATNYEQCAMNFQNSRSGE